MALFTVDANNTFGQSVEEAGTYNVVVAPSSQYAKAQQTGNPMAVLDYEVLDGKYKGGQIRFDNEVWDTSNDYKANLSIKRFNTIAVALGANNGTTFDSIEQFVSQAVGNRLAITVDWETGQNGKTYLTVKSHKPFMQDGSKPNGVKRPSSAPTTNQNSGFGNQQNGGFNGRGQSNNGGFGNAPKTNSNGDFGNQNANNTSFANQTGAGYKGGNNYDPVPDDMPF